MKTGIVAIALSVALSASVQAVAESRADQKEEPNRACQLVTPQEAASILGSNPKSPASSTQGCAYQVQGQSMELAIRTEAWAGETTGAYRIFELGHAKWADGDSRGQNPSIQSEPSLGEHASSVQSRDSFYLLVAVKKTLLEIELRDKGKAVPAPLVEKVRAIAKQAASRL